MRQEIKGEGTGEAISHYTDAVRFGDLLFISGVMPVDAEGRVVGGDAVTQVRQVFKNMAAILKAAGAGFGDVLKVTVYLTDVADRPRINPVRQEVFGKTRPASTLIGVKELALPGMKVEIDAVAGLKPKR
ncbi:MAG: RidA family protein [Stellaceae bacterium]|jgi:2-iminobutanoate/2-iminopropanoate deaminase